jgi:hypothetical protein
MDLELIRIKKDNSISDEFPTGELTERLVTLSQLAKINELLGDDYYNMLASDVDNIMNQYP